MRISNHIQLAKPLQWLRTLDFPHKKGILDRVFGKKLEMQGIGWAKIWTGHIWKIDSRNSCHRWMVYDRYADSNFLKWAEKNIPSDGIIIDSGSNIGQFLPYFSLIVPMGKILAFEPDTELVEWIHNCLQQNEMPVELISAGLGEIQQRAFLQKGGEDFIHGLWSKVSENEGYPISITTLHDELQKRDFKRVALWKLDVEGYEVEALKGAGTWLTEKKIDALYIEMAVKENNHQHIYDFMTKIGYKAYEFDESGRLIPLLKLKDYQIDALFIPE